MIGRLTIVASRDDPDPARTAENPFRDDRKADRMGDPACYRDYCPNCDAPLAIVDEECPECGAAVEARAGSS